MKRTAAAAVTPVRQRTQYTCMATSLMMCINAHGRDFDEDTVNKVMGAQPMQGASWESAIAAAQHFGFRCHMIVPATVAILKEWTDQGIPVMIAWNPEGRPWSHASVVFDVKADGTVFVADPNIPDPDETVRVVTKDEFYHKWFEKWPDYLVRRPALAIMPEVTPAGKQVVASKTATPKHPHSYPHLTAVVGTVQRVRPLGEGGMLGPNPHGIWAVKIDGTEYVVEGPIHRDVVHVGAKVDFWVGKTLDPIYDMPSAADFLTAQEGSKVAKAPTPVNPKKKDDGHTVHVKMPHPRDDVARAIAEKGGIPGTGAHHNREDAFEKGRSRKTKYPPKWDKEASADHLADRYMEKNHG